MKKQITYKSSGVDIDKADEFVSEIKKMTRRTYRKGLVAGIGGFSGLFRIPRNIKRPILVASTDGVGTKLIIANLQKQHETIGIDLVAMCVNDLITCGGEPLFFLDYYATGKLSLQKSCEILKGIIQGCREAGCVLLGGETAEMPGMYPGDDYDLAGFSVGIVDEGKRIDGKRVAVGDRIIGLHASGVHSNGFSLVRKLFSTQELKGQWGKTLLVPTRIYVKPVLKLAQANILKAAAHITGGGFTENIPRVIPRNKNVHIVRNSWKTLSVFKEIQERSNLSEAEMFRTFNMGIGMVLIISAKNLKRASALLAESRFGFSLIGEVKKGNGKVVLD